MGQALCKCGRPEEKVEHNARPVVVPQLPGRPSPDEVPEGFKVDTLKSCLCSTSLMMVLMQGIKMLNKEY
jgi:hypothetical protein